MNEMDSIAWRWMDWMVAASLQIALLVLIITVVNRLLGWRLPRLRHALWILVLIKVFLPPWISSPTGIVGWLGADPLLHPPWSATDEGSVIVSDSVLDPGGQSAGGEAAGATPFVGEAMSWPVWLMALWLVGCVSYWALVTWRYLRLKRLLDQADPVEEGPFRVALERTAMRLAIQTPPELRITDRLTSPLLIGIWNPSIVLPAAFVDQAERSQVDTVLVHELIHLRRRDHWLGWLQVFALGLFWFHPLVWWAMKQLSQQREEACDESVLCEANVSPTDYGEVMMRVLTSTRAKSVTEGGWVGIFEQGGQLQTRLERIMNHQPNSRSFGWGAKALVALAAITLLPMASWTDGIQAQESSASAGDMSVKAGPPRVVKTVPEVGATDVSPGLKEIRVTFDRDMSKGMSWTGGGPEFPSINSSQIARWIDDRTCVLPVQLKRGAYYRVGINSKSFKNFKSVEGISASASAIYFATQGASKETKAKAQRPEITQLDPANGSDSVNPNKKFLTVTFNMPMSAGMSWTGGGESFPTIPNGKKPRWSKDKKTCRLPVQLESGKQYQLGLNSRSHQNFRSENGVHLEPVLYKFKTK